MVEQWDCIHIRDLKFRCIVGINEDERLEKQDVVANLTLWADLTRACRTDNIEDTVDYKSLKKKILDMAEQSNFLLVEALSQAIADVCLSYDRVKQVKVCVEKPTALRFARTVGVEIVRTRDD
ncbi:MAG: dihydroneopterin aldolase [Phycisphaerae bacterium]|nr:dihydroneopterin aldolase [Phycisphaerae bacterium]